MVVKEYSLKIDTATAQKNVDELNSSFEAQTELIDELENDLFDYEKQLRKTSKTNLAARDNLNKKIQKTKDALKNEKKGLKDVTKERKKANESLKEAEENAADYSGVLGTIDSKTGGLISGFTGMTKSIGNATKGLNLMKIAIIGTGIGALLIAITSLSAAFTSSEEGQNKWNKMMGIIGATVSVFTDRLASLGRGLINLFTDPIETLKGFGKSIKEFVMDKVDQTVESLGFLGSAISKLFKGDFSGALEDAGKGVSGLNKALNTAVIITDALIKSTKELTKEILEEGKAAGKIADQRAAADKLDRQLIIDRAEANRKRAELLDKVAQKETFSVAERIQFLKEAAILEDEITAKEIKAAQLRLDAKIKENALGDSTKEDLQEEANLKANLINLETAKLTKAKLVSAQVVSVLREEEAEKARIKAEAKAKQDEIDAAEDEKAKELKTLKDEIKNAEAVTEDEKRALELEKVGAHYDKLIAEAKRLGLSTVKLEEAKAKAIDKINKTDSENEIKWEELTQQEKGAIISKGFNDLSSILGEETAAGKAAAIAAATISTYQSAQKSYDSLAGIPIIGPALGFAAAGAAVVSGFAQVKAISKTKVPTLGGKTPPSAGGSTPSAPTLGTPPSIPPAFNVVGASGTNQLAEAIGGQEQLPVQAYVVSNDISTAQSLERNIVEGATIG
jgi:lysozyme family protein